MHVAEGTNPGDTLISDFRLREFRNVSVVLNKRNGSYWTLIWGFQPPEL